MFGRLLAAYWAHLYGSHSSFSGCGVGLLNYILRNLEYIKSHTCNGACGRHLNNSNGTIRGRRRYSYHGAYYYSSLNWVH